jgi:hypothetical protein
MVCVMTTDNRKPPTVEASGDVAAGGDQSGPSTSKMRPRSLLEILAALEPIEEEFPPIEDLPPEPVEI